MTSGDGPTPPEPAPAKHRWRDLAIRIVGVVFGIALVSWTLRDLDPARVQALLLSVGAVAALILLPQGIGMLCHSAGWRALLGALGHRVPLLPLTRAFFASEAARMALPAGVAVGESIITILLTRQFAVPWTRALASQAAKKAWVMCTHTLVLIFLIAIGWSVLESASVALGAGTGGLLWGTVATAAMLALSGVVTLALLASRGVSRAVTRMLARVPWKRARAWAEAQQASPETAAAAEIPARAHVLAALGMLGQWAAEIFETWLVLRVLGIEVGLVGAMLIELGGSLVRSMAFFVPSGLGLQDATSVALLTAIGVPGATEVGAAFVVLKRTKDIAYVVVGLTLLALGRRRDRRAGLTAPDQPAT